MFVVGVIGSLLGEWVFKWVVKWVRRNMICVGILFEAVGGVGVGYWILEESVMMREVMGGGVIF